MLSKFQVNNEHVGPLYLKQIIW